MIGGFTGGSEPNCISLTRFRSVAGCCVGTAPTALALILNDCIADEDGVYTVNIPFDYETPVLKMESDLPDYGSIRLRAKKECSAGFRYYDWMGKQPKLLKNGQVVSVGTDSEILCAELKADDVLELVFDLQTVQKQENTRGTDFTVTWRGCDVIALTPAGEHVRLYQRDLSVPKYYPTPEDVEYTGAANYGPTQQKQ